MRSRYVKQRETLMTALFETLEQLARSEYLFRITDNGGETCDRYTVVFSDGDFLTLSGSPSHPQGVSLWGEQIDLHGLQEAVEDGAQVDLALGDLPPNVAAHVLSRLNEAWRDFLSDVEAQVPMAVAKSREHASVYEGVHTSGGKGIYRVGGCFAIRGDSDDAGDDYGPFDTVAEAVRMSLPSADALAGDDYQSSVNLGRLTPCPEVQRAILALEIKVEGDDGEPLDDAGTD
jgi:hypothetical protein